MTVYNKAKGSLVGFPSEPGDSVVHPRVLIDFAKINAAGVTTSDVVPIFQVPEGCLVGRIVYKIITADTGASTRTFKVGDTANGTGYFATADAKTAGYGTTTLTLTEAAPNTVTGYSGGKFYTAGDTIVLVPNQTLTNLRIEFVISLHNFNVSSTATTPVN